MNALTHHFTAKSMKAEIISIGTELLLGDIVDTNATHIAQQLRSIGLDVLYKTTVGDNEKRISEVIDHALTRVDIVIVSGGLGPTVDDVTREAIAAATQQPLEFHQELLDQIAERFRRFGAQMSENNRRQAMAPKGALAIENPVGTAPIFILETERGVILTLPGVPREMRFLLERNLLPWLAHYINEPAIIKSVILRTAGIGESQIDAKIADLMTAPNPTVGLAAHSGQTDIRVTAKAPTEQQAIDMLAPVEREIRKRIGSWIYGTGIESLEQVVKATLKTQGLSAAFVEIGTGGTLSTRWQGADVDPAPMTAFESYPDLKALPLIISSITSLEDLAQSLATSARVNHNMNFGIAVVVNGTVLDNFQTGTSTAISTPNGTRARTFGWGLDRSDSDIWATTHALSLLRRALINVQEPD